MFNMWKFILNKENSRKSLIFCFQLNKTAAESYRLLREVHGEHAQSQDAYEQYFQYFKGGDFDTRREGRRVTWKTAKKFEDVELQAWLDENESQTQKQLAEQLGVS